MNTPAARIRNAMDREKFVHAVVACKLTTTAMLVAGVVSLTGCSTPKTPAGYDQDTTPDEDGECYGGYYE